MKLQALSQLEIGTRDFFAKYWCKNANPDSPPQWTSWNLSGTPPEATLGGCYAVYATNRLLYIGVAVTEGKHAERTGKKYGLLDRLKRHVVQKGRRNADQFVPHKNYPKWNGMTEIRLIGFSDEHRHLAAALEIYLIKRLAPPINAETRWRES